jgi:hypothetical protein
VESRNPLEIEELEITNLKMETGYIVFQFLVSNFQFPVSIVF